MDNETRYMIANLITKHREDTDAENVFKKAKTNNNKVERLHNTVRDRQKVMRGLQNDDTAT